VRYVPRFLAYAGLAVVLLAGCGSGQTIEAKQLTIITTDAVLDKAASMAIAQYVQNQGTEVEIQQRQNYDSVFDELDQQTSADQARIGVVTARQEPAAHDHTVQLPEQLQKVSQAPVELRTTAVASTITATQFGQAQHQSTKNEAAQALETQCARLTWILPEALSDEVDEAMADLTDQGCEPEYETIGVMDIDTYSDIATRMTAKPNTVAMLYNVAPVISDLNLDTLELDNDPDTSNLVAVSYSDIEDSLEREISAVLEVLDAEATTELLRGYHNAYASESDLDYDVNAAVAYWLVEQDLVDEDTVADMSIDSD